MWLKRRERSTRLSRLLALGRLQEAMGRVEDKHGGSGPGPRSGVRYKVIARVPPGRHDGSSQDDRAKRGKRLSA
jgi:hypothetical protein